MATEQTIELSKHERAEAIASLQRYFEENLAQTIGDLPAGLLLNYFLEEIGPLVYNRAVSDVQAHLQVRVADLSGEVFVEGLQYWPRADQKRRGKR
jgi:uncharacterized protein (DUF2164 family)